MLECVFWSFRPAGALGSEAVVAGSGCRLRLANGAVAVAAPMADLRLQLWL